MGISLDANPTPRWPPWCWVGTGRCKEEEMSKLEKAKAERSKRDQPVPDAGWYENEFPACPLCKGTGEDVKKKVCPNCHGTGTEF